MCEVFVTIRDVLFICVLTFLSTCISAQELQSWEKIGEYSVDGDAIHIKTSYGDYKFPHIINNLATVKQKNQTVLLVEYGYFASRTKRLELVEFGVKGGRLVLLRIDSYSYDSLDNISFGCSVLFDVNEVAEIITVDSIVTLGSVCSNYDLIGDGNDFVRIRTKKNVVEIPVLTLDSTKTMIPVFYKNGAILGYYHLYGIKTPSDILSSELLNEREFSSVGLGGKGIVERNDVGYYLERAGRFRDAIKVLEEVLEISPERAVAYLNIADAYLGCGDLSKAKENYNTYVELMTKENKASRIPSRVIKFLSK